MQNKRGNWKTTGVMNDENNTYTKRQNTVHAFAIFFKTVYFASDNFFCQH